MHEDNKQDQPGQVIGPQTGVDVGMLPPVQAAPTEDAPAEPAPAPVTPEPAPDQSGSFYNPAPAPEPAQVEEASFYNPGASASASAADSPATPSSSISWSASEYMANPKGPAWYAGLAAGTVAVGIIAYYVTHDILSLVALAVLAGCTGFIAGRPPHVLTYKIDPQGVQVGDKFYAYANFKSFSVVAEHAMGYISLAPLKRFMPPMAIHYAPEDEEAIIDTLATYLPYEDYQADIVESLTHRLRF